LNQDSAPSLNDMDDKQRICATRRKGFYSEQKLQSHMRTHLPKKSKKSCIHICTICGKKYKNKSHYDNHVRTHTGKTPFVCIICCERFNDKKGLTRHKKIHKGKMRICSRCEKYFDGGSTLQTLEKEHTCSLKQSLLCENCQEEFCQSVESQDNERNIQELGKNKMQNSASDTCTLSNVR
jgi:KRAB domain-containing zinc finger protein